MNEEGGLQHGVDFDELDIDRDRKAIMRRFELDRKALIQFSSLKFHIARRNVVGGFNKAKRPHSKIL